MALDNVDATAYYHVLHDAHDNAWVVDLKHPCLDVDCTRDHVNISPAANVSQSADDHHP